MDVFRRFGTESGLRVEGVGGICVGNAEARDRLVCGFRNTALVVFP
jgi:hypothetical protein